MVNHALATTIADSQITDDDVRRSAAALWGMFEALEAVPATPEVQNVFSEARRLLNSHIHDATGLNPDMLRAAFLDAGELLRCRSSRGDPTLSA